MPNPQPNPPRRAAPSLDYLNGVRAKYQLPPQSDGVGQIAGLVKGKDESSMEEIAQIIAPSKMMTQRLMTAAFPKPAARLGATTEMAASRLGVSRVIVMFVADLLKQAVLETFETMVSLTLETGEATVMPLATDGYLAGTVKFTGQTCGKVTLSFSPMLSWIVTAKLMGGNIDDDYPPEIIHDAIGELVNIVTGNLQSKLCDGGLASEVGMPQVALQASLPTETIPGGSSEQFYFRQGSNGLGVHLCIAPFSSNR